MIAEVISIGDELTSGQRLDTNSQWLSERLGELGVRVVYHTTVADELAANVAVFRAGLARADVIVATGGLGPTADDLTRDVLAEVSGRELLLDEASLEHIRGLFARHKRDMPERNRVQAIFRPAAASFPIPTARRRALGSTWRGRRGVFAACSRCRACRPRCSRCSRKPWRRRSRRRKIGRASFAIDGSNALERARATSSRCCPI